ncbi:MAG: LysM peptidoglycan-binding domain-containing protein [Bacteroidales bacterium]|nr:LysM peptidoglycan-binding domain-containing protein [Bacteroidales bacterium]
MKTKGLFFSLIVLLSSSVISYGQLFGFNQINQLKDSIQVLNAKIDSLQTLYDEFTSAINMVSDEDNTFTGEEADLPVEIEDLQRQTDSLLTIWYLQHNLANTLDADLVDVEDAVFASDIPDSVYIARLNKMNSYIKIPYNNYVRNYIIQYTQKMPGKIEQILGLAKYYLPIFEEILIEYDLPVELKAMAVIESALNQKAVSRAKAKGMWQFMYKTALTYNLDIDSYVDERFDPEASCRAAARYLRDSYDIFGDWSLAIASYNCGAGNVNKAIRRSGGGKDFWEVYKYLPRETRGYVPAFVGALYTLEYYKEHNLVPAAISLPAHVDTFHVNKNLHFGQISENLGITVEELRDLNPQYLFDIIPGEKKEYILKLPFNYTMAFVEKENQIYGYKDSVYFDPVKIKQINSGVTAIADGSYITHKVTSGQTLSGIAAKYGTTVTNIKSWNNLKSNTIRVGQNLRIYGKNAAPSSSSSSTSVATTTSSDGYVMYTVKKGDTLWDIANKFSGVTLHDILTINGFSRNSKIYPGMKIKIKKQ